ncbi:DUF6415 family natural product biosynthesis protein [Streptomyces sp. KHY 26]|uniref:DUF6415 family natural product biosynthesis protein n=1 Tax=Streptomyces sp. KHY 26 TaxID=3097359 RepID=UPI00376EFC79
MSDVSARVDALTIRRTYDSVLWAVEWPTGEEAERLRALLTGHVQLLIPEVEGALPSEAGMTRETAELVVMRAREVLGEGPAGGLPGHVHDLAVCARALLTLHESPELLRPAPDDSPEA